MTSNIKGSLIWIIFIFLSNVVFADNHNLNEVLELIQKDLKILEN